MTGTGNPVFESIGGDVSGATVADPATGNARALSDWLGSLATLEQIVRVSASEATTLPQPAGNTIYLVTPTAPATLSLPTFPANAPTWVTVIVIGANLAVTLPTTGVSYKAGDVPAADTTAGRVTLIRYLSVPGASTIIGGI
ncbi:hypothetical protein HW509_06730 [Asaia spathodeae]|uniref:hypothetical protein n=1 Tax=Asaia spathodeae TaxID=657016 RepID=UPI002FC32705